MTTLYLRTPANETLADIEIESKNGIVTDLHSVVAIKNYSLFLFNNYEDFDYIVEQFESLSELRGWLFETRLSKVGKDEPTHTEIENEVKSMYEELAQMFDLVWVVD